METGNVSHACEYETSMILHLAPNLVASTHDVKLLVRTRQQGKDLPAESLLTRGWRSLHVLPDLLAVLDGRRRLRVADVAAETPFTLEDIGG